MRLVVLLGTFFDLQDLILCILPPNCCVELEWDHVLRRSHRCAVRLRLMTPIYRQKPLLTVAVSLIAGPCLPLISVELSRRRLLAL
jgi:hypothetical protein